MRRRQQLKYQELLRVKVLEMYILEVWEIVDLFPSRVIKNLSISKTFNSASFVDQSSGHININSRVFSKKGTKLSFSSGVNTNTFDVFDNFSRSQNANITNFGFYSSKLTKLHALKYQSWNTVKDAPVNSNVSFSTSQKISLGEEDLKIFFSLAQGNSFSYRNGLFREFDQNNLRANYSDATRFSTKINTTALLNLDYKFNPSNKLQYVSMFINNTKDEVFEAGRNKLGYKFDQEPSEFGSFVRDQNIKQTTIFINQLLGSHNLSEKNELSWGVGLNVVNAKEPNRIRNEVNFGLDDELFNVIKSQSIYSSGFADSRFQTDVSSVDFLKFSNVGGYQNAKTGQFFKDNEINGYLKDKLNLISKENNEGDIIQKRQRSREFESNRYGFSNSLEISATEIDNLAISFTPEIIESGSISYTLPLELKEVYSGTFSALAGFTNISYMANKFSTVLGLRYESDVYDVSWDVVNSSDGNIKETFNSFSPSLSLKYDLKDNSSLRFIGSITTSLPEIKELAPFQYAYPSGRVVTGNPALKPSTNYNLDLKYELFPSSEELFSVTGFYKQILDPINFTTQPGAAGNFYNENTGEKATIYGLELESRVKLIEVEDEFDLNLNLNTTLMDHKQDLSANYQYGDVTEAKLAGASNFIINAGLNFNTKSKHEFNAALTGNYTSDIVYALGAPRDQGNKETIYNDKIIEKGFTTLNLTLSKELTEKISIGGNFRNLLNPSITQTQDVRDLSTGIINNYEVSNYKKGVNISFSFNYNF